MKAKITVPIDDPRLTPEWIEFLANEIAAEWPHLDIEIVRASCGGTRVLVTENVCADASDVEMDILGGCERAWEAWQSQAVLKAVRETFGE